MIIFVIIRYRRRKLDTIKKLRKLIIEFQTYNNFVIMRVANLIFGNIPEYFMGLRWLLSLIKLPKSVPAPDLVEY